MHRFKVDFYLDRRVGMVSLNKLAQHRCNWVSNMRRRIDNRNVGAVDLHAQGAAVARVAGCETTKGPVRPSLWKLENQH